MHECDPTTQIPPSAVFNIGRLSTRQVMQLFEAIPDDLAPTSIQSILIDDVRDFVCRDHERGVALVSALTNSKLKAARIAASDSVAGLVSAPLLSREPFDEVAELWATLLADPDEEVSGIAEDHLALAVESERISQVDAWAIFRAMIKGLRPE